MSRLPSILKNDIECLNFFLTDCPATGGVINHYLMVFWMKI